MSRGDAGHPDPHVRWLADVGRADTPTVGGKNASLGELLRNLVPLGVRVPHGFSTTADAFRRFLEQAPARDEVPSALAAYREGRIALKDAGARLRAAILATPWPEGTAAAIAAMYRRLCAEAGGTDVDVAVRSSATAEDLADASFAGQHDSFLNIRGEAALLDACRRCFASLFNDRAIAYRDAKGFDHGKVALCVGVQRMVRSDLAGAGVMFSIDTESGCPSLVLINGAWGAGETVVQGAVNPDQVLVAKPQLADPALVPIVEKTLGSKLQKRVYADGGELREVPCSARERSSFVLSDRECLELARWAVAVERHYGMPMDMEWAKDGDDGLLYLVQARPETVHATRGSVLRRYTLEGRAEGRVALAKGLAVGDAIAAGPVARIDSARDMDKVPQGAILVTRMTDPDWVPVMRRVAGIVTDEGGRTCHAAIVSRELGVPTIVGTQDGTQRLRHGDTVTLSCAEGAVGRVYAGRLPFRVDEVRLGEAPATRTKVLLSVGSPEEAVRAWSVPADGIGLARIEFLIADRIGCHPLAALHPERVQGADRARVDALAVGHRDAREGYVDRLARGIALIAASRYPQPVVVRTSDFKSNEYAGLAGGAAFEPKEENPMIGWRGCSRYVAEPYREAFRLECEAIRRARTEMGMANIDVLLPFCRSPQEADAVLALMAECGLRRGEDGLKVLLMCEIPTNVLRVDDFASRFDGFSIGSNDLTQLTLGIDRDSGRLRDAFDERDPAVVRLLLDAIAGCHRNGIPVGICGQAPADFPDLAARLVRAGIDSVSVNAERVPATRATVAAAEPVGGEASLPGSRRP